jgi:putative hydrolase of HD superfamily
MRRWRAKEATPVAEDRLAKQIEFIVQIDKLKGIMRQNVVTGSRRPESDAEHSWHLAMMAVLLAEYAAEPGLDVARVVKMALVHDLVEIDAGDTFCYDEAGNIGKEEREQQAAARLFALLPADQAAAMMALWQEFEAMETPEASFANCLDRLQPLLLNYNTEGHTWKKPGVNRAKVLKRNQVSEANAPRLWQLACQMIEDSVKRGLLKP